MALSVDLTKTTITDLPSDIEVEKVVNTYLNKPTALAIALGVTAESILTVCQHDGSEIVCDKTVDDSKYRGFTAQEIVDICLMQGFAVKEVDRALGDDAPANYDRSPTPNHRRVIVEWERFEQELLNSQGVAIYHKEHDALEHVLAYRGDGKTVTLVDPENEVKFLYKDQNDLVERGIQLITLLCINKAK